jgi:hypothetical protein
MLNNNHKKTYLPQCDGAALDFIKIAAALFMIIDHMNTIWFGHEYFLMILIGRGTFPLFCYAVAVAVMRAKGPPLRYAARLAALAVLSQPFYYFAMGDKAVNVVFTLAAGSLVAALSSRLKLQHMYLLYAAAIVSMLWVLPLEFGLAGVMLPSAILLALRGHKGVYPFLVLLLLFINAAGMLEPVPESNLVMAVFACGLLGLASIFVPYMVLDAARNLKQTGRLLPKYALHVFYPAHLALLKLLGPVLLK